jgi:hypothetical protein
VFRKQCTTISAGIPADNAVFLRLSWQRQRYRFQHRIPPKRLLLVAFCSSASVITGRTQYLFMFPHFEIKVWFQKKPRATRRFVQGTSFRHVSELRLTSPLDESLSIWSPVKS